MVENAERRYRLSAHLRFLRMSNGQMLVAHPFRLTRALLREDMFLALALFRDGPLTLDEFRGAIEDEQDLAAGVWDFFAARSLIVPEDTDEDDLLRGELGGPSTESPLVDSSADGLYRVPTAIGRSLFAARRGAHAGSRLRVLILGGCFSQLAAEALVAQGIEYQLDVSVTTGWPDRLDLLEQTDAQVVVYQPGTTYLLRPIWDNSPFIAEDELEERLAVARESLATDIREIRRRTPGRLLLVQGFSEPQFSPLGRAEFRRRTNFATIVFALNERIRELIRDDLDALYVDQSRLASGIGKQRLMDDALAPYSHHGPIDFDDVAGLPKPPGPSRAATFGVTTRLHMPQLLAGEYLQCYRLWSGMGRIKCVVVDLDNTLWGSVVGDEGLSLDDPQAQDFRFGTTAGIHQALKIVAARGVLLATCSRNTASVVEEEWAKLEAFAESEGLDYLLRRDDFVVHRINWQPKSENIAEIMHELGLAGEAVLFIDDSPVERAEVARAHPSIRVLGENMNLVRSVLLGDPGLDSNAATRENLQRGAMVKAQLERDRLRPTAESRESFLKTLGIRLTVRRLSTDATVLARVIDLFQRTNQFNTSLIRYGAHDIHEIVAGETAELYVLEVEDRFTQYGIVGACVARGAEIEAFALSCRVIGLDVSVPFLVAVIRHRSTETTHGRIIKGPRNAPCRQLFVNCGFTDRGDGRFELASPAELPVLAPTHTLSFVEEA